MVAAKSAGEANVAKAAEATQAVSDATTTAVKKFTEAAEATTPAVEAAGAKVQDVVDTLTAQAKQAGNAWLDAYDQGFAAFLELRSTLAEATKVDAVIELAATNSNALEQLNARVRLRPAGSAEVT